MLVRERSILAAPLVRSSIPVAEWFSAVAAVYVQSEGGKIAAARIYDDANPPLA
jgi:hypothetical protein